MRAEYKLGSAVGPQILYKSCFQPPAASSGLRLESFPKAALRTRTSMAKTTATARPAKSASGGFQPYVADDAAMPELTVPAVLIGVVLGIVFGASSLYLVLKVGLTVSASIP